MVMRHTLSQAPRTYGDTKGTIDARGDARGGTLIYTLDPVRLPEIIPVRFNLVVTAEAYTAKDAVGGKMIIRNVGKSGVIRGFNVIDQAAQDVDYKLALFDADFTATADGAAFAPSDADLRDKALMPLTIETHFAYNDNSATMSGDVLHPYTTNNNEDALFMQMWTDGTPTYVATTDVSVLIYIEPSQPAVQPDLLA
jgi:hypothetical protein